MTFRQHVALREIQRSVWRIGMLLFKLQLDGILQVASTAASVSLRCRLNEVNRIKSISLGINNFQQAGGL